MPNVLNFYHEQMLSFVKCFFCVSWQIVRIFFFLLIVTWGITLIGWYTVNHPCILEKDSTWSQWITLSMCCWIWFASILMRIFMFTLPGILVWWTDILIWLWCQSNIGLVKWTWECQSSSNFGKSLRRIGISSSFNALLLKGRVKFTRDAIWSWACLCWDFLFFDN